MKYVPRKDVRKIVQQLQKAGWRIEQRSKHVLAFPPDGASRPITLGNVSDSKAGGATLRNMVSNIERADPKLRDQIKIS